MGNERRAHFVLGCGSSGPVLQASRSTCGEENRISRKGQLCLDFGIEHLNRGPRICGASCDERHSASAAAAVVPVPATPAVAVATRILLLVPTEALLMVLLVILLSLLTEKGMLLAENTAVLGGVLGGGGGTRRDERSCAGVEARAAHAKLWRPSFPGA